MAKVESTTTSTTARRLAINVALSQLRVDDLLQPSMTMAYGAAEVRAAKTELETIIRGLAKNLEDMGGRPAPRAAFVALVARDA